MRMIALIGLLSAISTGSASASSESETSPRMSQLQVLTPVPGVKEPFFALMLSLFTNDVQGELSSERIRAELTRQGRQSKIPWELLQSVERRPCESQALSRFDVKATRPIRLDLPYDILGYNPGTLRGSTFLSFEEWDFGDVTFNKPPQDGKPPEPVTLTAVRVLGLAEGYFEVDVDGWVDRILGSKIDDTRLVGLAYFSQDGKMYGLSFGYNPEGEGRTGLFDFSTDQIVFPLPPEYRLVGGMLRTRLEQLMPGLRDRSWVKPKP